VEWSVTHTFDDHFDIRLVFVLFQEWRVYSKTLI
jgi:hypothetical protein